MLKIRLKRVGRKNSPAYRIVVTDAKNPRDGKCCDKLGHYQPLNKNEKEQLVVDLERLADWIKKGAQPTEKVKHLLKKGA